MKSKSSNLNDTNQLFKSQTHNWFEFLASVFLWQESIDPKISLVLFAAGRFQLACIIIWTQFYSVSQHNVQDQLTNFVLRIVQYGNANLLEEKSSFESCFSIFAILIFIYMGILVLIIGLLLYGFFTKRTFPTIETIYCFLGGIHNEIIFWYINLFCLKFLMSDGRPNNFFDYTVDTNSIGWIILISLLLLINMGFCAISLVFRYDPFKTENLMSCWKPSCQVMTGLFKTVQSAILICLPKTNFSITVFWVICLLVITIQKHALHHQFPFYHSLGMRISVLFNCVSLSFGYPAALLYFFNGMNALSPLTLIYLQLMLFLIVVKISFKLIEKQLTTSLASLTEGVKQEEDVFKTMLMLSKLQEFSKMNLNSHGKLDSLDEIYFFSILKVHNSYCDSHKCSCRYLLHQEKQQIWLNEIKSHVNDINFEMLFKFFKDSAQTLKESHRVNIYLAYLELFRSSSGRKALVTLFSIPRKKISFILRVGLDKLIMKLKQNINQYYDFNQELVNVAEFFHYEQSSNHLITLIEQATQHYLDFWTHYKQNRIFAPKLLNFDHKFELKANEIDKIWNKFAQDFPDGSKNFGLKYSSYLSVIRNSNDKASKLLKAYTEWNNKSRYLYQADQILRENVTDPRNIAIYVSMKKETLGIILEASPNVHTFGYTKDALIGKNINTLLLNCMQQQHQAALQKHIEQNPKADVLHKNLRVFAKKKLGDVIQLHAYFAICPQFKDQLIYIGLLREIHNDKDYIILNEKGKIDALSEGVFFKFCIKQLNGITLNDIFEDPSEIERFILRKKTTLAQRSSGHEKSEKYGDNDVFKRHFIVLPKGGPECELEDRLYVSVFRIATLNTYIDCIEINYHKIQRNKNNGSMFFQTNIASSHSESKSNTEDEVSARDFKEGANAQKVLKFPIVENQTSPDLDSKSESEGSDTPKINKKKSLKKAQTTEYPESITFVSDEDDSDPKPIQIIQNAKNSTGSVMSVSRSRSIIPQIEKAIFDVPIGSSLRLMNFNLLVYGLQAMTMLLSYTLVLENEYADLDHDIEYGFYVENGTELMINIHLNIERMKLTYDGLLPENLYSSTQMNQAYLKEKIIENTVALHNLSQAYLSLIQNHDQVIDLNEYRFSIFDDYATFDMKANIIDYMQLASTSLGRIIYENEFENYEQRDVKLILKNNLNGYVQMSEKILQKVFHNAIKENDPSSNLLTAGLAITIIWGLSVILIYIYLEKMFNLNQRRLFEGLLRINELLLGDHLNQLGNKKLEKFKSTALAFGGRAKENDFSNKGKKDDRPKKTVDFGNKGNKFITSFGYLIFILGLYMSAFIIIQDRIDSNTNTDFGSVSGLITDTYNLIETKNVLHLLSPLTESFITSHNTTFFNGQPVENAWESLYDTAIENQERVNYLVSRSQSQSSLQLLLTGNICNYLFMNSTTCTQLNKGYTENGIIGMNNGIFHNIMELKQSYTSSDGSLTDIRDILNSTTFKEYETMTMNIFSTAYDSVQSVFRSMLKEKMDETYNFTQNVWISYCVLLVVTTLLSKYFILNSMYDDRMKNRKLLRIVPSHLIMNNNFLKVYLRDNCDNQIDHVFKKY